MGSQPSASSAASSTFFGPSAATTIGMRSRTGWLISLSGFPRPVPRALRHRVFDRLEGLPEPGPLARRQRERVVLPGIFEPLAPPHLPADLDDLPGPADRRVIRHGVAALDHLRPGRPDAQHEPPA